MNPNKENKPIIQCKDLWKIYSINGNKVNALKNINTTIKKGEFVLIVGKSGSGKTTFINVIAGLTKPTSGNVKINGQDLTNLSNNQLSILRRKKIGIIFQMFNLHQGLTALENVELPMLFSGIEKDSRRSKAKELLKTLGLTDLFRNYPDELSGGEKQRVAIARALANDPEIILADEPTGNLHSQLAQEIVELLLEINKQKQVTIIMVTHNDMLIKKNMKVITLMDGKIGKIVET